MPDGNVILVKIAAGRITRVYSDGTKETVAEAGGGPNGMPLGEVVRGWKADRQCDTQTSGLGTFVPLIFQPGEAYQFDWR